MATEKSSTATESDVVVAEEKSHEAVVIKNFDELDNALEKLGVNSSLFLVTRSGPTKQIGQQAKRKITQHEVIGPVTVNDASWEEAKRIASMAQSMDADYIFGVGGGKVGVDVKLASHLSEIPLILLPTALTNDGLDSTLVSVKQNSVPESITIPPYKKIYPRELYYAEPPRLTLAGIGEIVAKISSVHDWKLATELDRETVIPYDKKFARTLIKNAYMLVDDLRKIKNSGLPFNKNHPLHNAVIDDLLYAAVEDGEIGSKVGSSRPLSGSEHLYAAALDSLYKNLNLENPLLHGEANAQGTILCLHLQCNPLWKELLGLFSYAGLDVVNSVPDKTKVDALIYAKQIGQKRGRYTILDEYNLDPSSSRGILHYVGLVK